MNLKNARNGINPPLSIKRVKSLCFRNRMNYARDVLYDMLMRENSIFCDRAVCHIVDGISVLKHAYWKSISPKFRMMCCRIRLDAFCGSAISTRFLHGPSKAELCGGGGPWMISGSID